MPLDPFRGHKIFCALLSATQSLAPYGTKWINFLARFLKPVVSEHECACRYL